MIIIFLNLVIGKTHKLRTLNDEDIARDFSSLDNKSLKQMVNKQINIMKYFSFLLIIKIFDFVVQI